MTRAMILVAAMAMTGCSSDRPFTMDGDWSIWAKGECSGTLSIRGESGTWTCGSTSGRLCSSNVVSDAYVELALCEGGSVTYRYYGSPQDVPFGLVAAKTLP